jgi:hypothetical protein
MMHNKDRRALSDLMNQYGTVAVLQELVIIRAAYHLDNTIVGRHVQAIADAVVVLGGHEQPLVKDYVVFHYVDRAPIDEDARTYAGGAC